MALGGASLSTVLTTSESLVAKIPSGISFEEAAALPTAYVTALAALRYAGGLSFGQVRTFTTHGGSNLRKNLAYIRQRAEPIY